MVVFGGLRSADAYCMCVNLRPAVQTRLRAGTNTRTEETEERGGECRGHSVLPPHTENKTDVWNLKFGSEVSSFYTVALGYMCLHYHKHTHQFILAPSHTHTVLLTKTLTGVNEMWIHPPL